MTQMCGKSVEIWEIADVVPVHKKDEKRLVKKLWSYYLTSNFQQNIGKGNL